TPWNMSESFVISSIWLMSITSEITLRLCASAALRSIFSPCSPSPWNAYGELRGLNAPPRRIFAPARLTAAAVACTCSSVSAEHGPAMTITSSPPIRTSSMVTMVSSGRKVRLARLYGSVMRSTSWTPSSSPISSGSILWAPTTPSTVRVTPDDRCTSIPSSIRRAITASTCASGARSFITTTMTSLSRSTLPNVFRESKDPRREFCRSQDRHCEGRSRPPIASSRAGAATAFAGNPFGTPCLVDDPLEDANHGLRLQRSRELGRRCPDPREHLRLSLGLIDGQPRFVLQPSDLHGACHAHVQKPYQLLVDHVDAASQFLDGQDFSQRTYSSTRVVRSPAGPASAMTFTTAPPTPAARAHCA